ncbi:Rap1a/Tai family immunity protein [Parerythrobacter aurantius]|uniref:Rap1a/Tai family immunity protein n=1 Tax=Parerythrobacter aurantius TaxID=3127706 RepID=UPI00324EA943
MVLSPSSAFAQDITAQSIFKNGYELLEQCGSSDASNLARCDWYIMGIWDAFGLLADIEATERYMCLAAGTPVDVLRGEVVAYLQRSDADLSKSAVSAVVNALIEANPC